MAAGAPSRIRRLPSWLLAEAARRGDRLVAAGLADRGLRKHHYAVLATLLADGASSQAALGRTLGIDRSNMHAIVNELVDRGYVGRRPDARDPRRNAIEISDSGVAAMSELDGVVAAAQERLLDALSPPERAQLTALLAKVCASPGRAD